MTFRSKSEPRWKRSFSALQRAEIAEMMMYMLVDYVAYGFSALQRAEIAEIYCLQKEKPRACEFQCSSTSRNC